MIRALAICLTLLPSLAQALSCVPWDVTNAYLRADAAEEAYVPVLGTLEFDETLLPVVDLIRQDHVPPLTEIPARFEGHALGPRGGVVAFVTDVTLKVQCFGPWCPSAVSGPVLGFLQKEGQTYSLTTDPCGSDMFSNPAPEQIKALRDCLDGGPCAPKAFP